MPVRVKICGITNAEDARFAASAGADALGFIFFKGSPRFITIDAAAEITGELPPFVAKVGVFVDEALETVNEIGTRLGLTAVQLHGNESAEYCSSVRLPVIKAFRVKDESSLRDLGKFRAAAFLLDSFVPGQLGGTGAKFNWDLAVQAKKLGTSVILAGGLTPENIAEAVKMVQPYAVDVSSGVEKKPGLKDPQKVADFIQSAKTSG